MAFSSMTAILSIGQIFQGLLQPACQSPSPVTRVPIPRHLSRPTNPGDRIPPELELCDFYRVSRITIRRGIEQLVQEHLLVRHRAKGTFVREWDEPNERDGHFTLAASYPAQLRVRGTDGALFASFTTWFTPVEGFPTDSSECYGSFTAMLREHGIVVDRAQDCIECDR